MDGSSGRAGSRVGCEEPVQSWGWDGCEADGAACVRSVCCICHVLLSWVFPLAVWAKGSVMAPPSLIFHLPLGLCLCLLAQQSFLRASRKGVQLH